jgi:hypothetical protein
VQYTLSLDFGAIFHLTRGTQFGGAKQHRKPIGQEDDMPRKSIITPFIITHKRNNSTINSTSEKELEAGL